MLLASLEIPVETAIRALPRGFDAGMLTILNPAPAPALAESAVRELLSSRGRHHAQPRRGPGAGGDECGIRRPKPDWTACGRRLHAMGPGGGCDHAGIGAAAG